MRLDKFVSHATGMTRSQCRGRIKNGVVFVNGEMVRDLARAVSSADTVALQDQVLRLPGHLYYMLNKPQGYVCATEDSEHGTVLDLLPRDLARNLNIAGRLDLDTTGLVLLSNDGQWLHRVSSPNYRCDKRYEVTLSQPLKEEDCQAFAEGLRLRGEEKKTKPALLRIIDSHRGEVTIQEGRYHQVKRMFAAIGNHVVALHRSQVGAIQLDPALKAGEFRALSEEEVASV